MATLLRSRSLPLPLFASAILIACGASSGDPPADTTNASSPDGGAGPTTTTNNSVAADGAAADASSAVDGAVVDGAAASSILPADRRIDWRASGVPGGIPARAVCQTIAAGASAATIQQALDSPACQNKAVVLAAGNYTIGGGLTIPSNVTLRGAGPTATTLVASGSGAGFIRLGPGATPNIAGSITVAQGATAGSTSLTLQNVSTVQVGGHLLITQLNDPSYVSNVTSNGTCAWCDGGIGWNGTRLQGQIVEVVAVDTQTKVVTVDPPLYVDYAKSPLATPFTMGAKHAGVEDLRVTMKSTGFTANFNLNGAAYSWVKNVDSNFTDGDHVRIQWGFRNEVRDSYFHDAYTHSPGTTDACLFIADKSTANLIENNALRRLHASVMLNWGAAGNVIGYNYSDNAFDESGTNNVFGALMTHGAHPMFNLFEGNVASQLNFDFFWGTTSHNVAFRNWFRGAEKIIPPLTGTGPEQPESAYFTTYGVVAVDIAQTVKHVSLLGNVIGSEHQISTGKTWAHRVVAPTTRSLYTATNAYGYCFGYANTTDDGSADGNNAAAFSTALIHGDFDFVTKSFEWSSSVATKSLPASFYRASKPSWWGSLPWPAFGPDVANPDVSVVESIPAKKCWEQGKMPGCVP